MPNHVKTVIKFKGVKTKEERDFIVHAIASPSPGDETTAVIDFNKIIPEPRTIAECDEEFIVMASSKEVSIEEDEDRPWFNWYDWHIANWGTKWNAYNAYTQFSRSEKSITFVFSTAWSLAEPIIKKLALLGYEIDVAYADEDIGHNCGRFTYRKLGGWTHYDEDELDNPVEFAQKLWDIF